MGVEREVHGVRVAAVGEVNSAQYDALVLVTAPGLTPPQALEDFVAAARQLDAELERSAALLHCPRVSGARLVLAPTGELGEYEDVRAVRDAARAGVARALAAGARRPALVLQPLERWPDAPLVALLAALELLYVPLQIRETFPELAHKVTALGVYAEGLQGSVEDLIREAVALEVARLRHLPGVRARQLRAHRHAGGQGRDVRHGRLRHQGGRRNGRHVARQVRRRRGRRLS